jgi:malate dehydrogenase (oxaloacetate-decarboxylating)
MIMAAAKALAALSPARADKSAPLLPPVAEARKTSLAVAEAAGMQAIADGVAEDVDEASLAGELRAYVWEPEYLPYERVP